MEQMLLLLVLPVSFLTSFAFIKLLKGRMLSLGIAGIDINKPGRPKIPEACGMLLLPGIWALILALVWIGVINPIAYMFLSAMTAFAAIGFFDDGFKLFKRVKGWSKYVVQRGLALFLFTVPFTYMMLGEKVAAEPLFAAAFMAAGGLVVLAAASLANSFAGLNGWEVGSSAIVIAGLTAMAAFSSAYTATLVTLCLIMLGAAIALFYFNRFPARVFPGDSGTFLMGAFMGCTVLFIDRWYLAFGLFLPHAYDIILKARTNSGDMSQKKEMPYALTGDGRLSIPESGKLDFAKLIIKVRGPRGEKEITAIIRRVVANNTLFWVLLYVLMEALKV